MANKRKTFKNYPLSFIAKLDARLRDGKIKYSVQDIGKNILVTWGEIGKGGRGNTLSQ